MTVSLQIEELKGKFAEAFLATGLEYEHVAFGDGIVHVFFITVKNAEQLSSVWRKASNFMALHFQSGLEDDFQVWNLYIFYRIEERVDNDLTYLVENDTFSSRKIIVGLDRTNEEIIAEHILNSDLSITEQKIEGVTFMHNPVLWQCLKDKGPNKIVTEEHKKLFKKITDKIRPADENKKS